MILANTIMEEGVVLPNKEFGVLTDLCVHGLESLVVFLKLIQCCKSAC